MSYHRKQKRLARAPLGDVSTVVKAVATGVDVINDPYFPETLCHIQQLKQIENGLAVQRCARTAPNLSGGVGLRKAMPAVRVYVEAERYRPWSYLVGAGVVLGLPMLVGYALGRRG